MALEPLHADYTRPNLSVATATDILWFYYGYYSYSTLTDENDWTLAAAEEWLLGQAGDLLCLAQGPGEGRAPRPGQ